MVGGQAGKERDKETGYDYFGFRSYDAQLARWLSVDPFEDPPNKTGGQACMPG